LGKVWPGQACAGANEEELTTCAKKIGQEEKINLEFRAPGHGRRAIAGHCPALAA
jgi:hypothetical protein